MKRILSVLALFLAVVPGTVQQAEAYHLCDGMTYSTSYKGIYDTGEFEVKIKIDSSNNVYFKNVLWGHELTNLDHNGYVNKDWRSHRDPAVRPLIDDHTPYLNWSIGDRVEVRRKKSTVKASNGTSCVFASRTFTYGDGSRPPGPDGYTTINETNYATGEEG